MASPWLNSAKSIISSLIGFPKIQPCLKSVQVTGIFAWSLWAAYPEHMGPGIANFFRIFNKLRPRRLLMIALLSLMFFQLIAFQNCSFKSSIPDKGSAADPPSTPENFLWLESEVPPGLPTVDYFSASKPKDMSGRDGYRFLHQQYIDQKCSMCHRPPLGNMPHFGLADPDVAYDIAKAYFVTWDIQYRVTRNPHCPQCNLDQRGEVYQAIRYWLDHR